jgi:hypothetical protein
MPARRRRTSPRVVERAISENNVRGKVDVTTCEAAVTIDIITPPLTRGDGP